VSAGNTLVAAWTAARRRLEAAGVDSPVLDARMLVEAGAGVARIDIVTDPQRALNDAQWEAVEALVVRREAREPISHIVGKKGFWTLELAVTPAVLTPRPETELLVAHVIERTSADADFTLLDLGVGSGAILLAILAERARASGVGVDSSVAALAVAQANSAALELSARAAFVHGEWEAADGAFDFVVSNPPYVRSGDIETLAPEVAKFEPRAALDGGLDGLESYRRIVEALPRLLKPGGSFALEIGQGQAEAVWALASRAGLRPEGVRKDLAGIDRVVWGAGAEPGGS
jgi:release factor glutamine methyltransferase